MEMKFEAPILTKMKFKGPTKDPILTVNFITTGGRFKDPVFS